MIKIRPQKTLRKIFQFIKEVKLEMKKITWLTLSQTLKYTLVVVAFSIVTAIFLGAIDFTFTSLLNKFIL